jgi:hypothetical protein
MNKIVTGHEIKPRANLSRADLSRADLSRANLFRADLFRADLSGANLSRADLFEADLSGANGIVSFGPVGNERRIGYMTSAGVQLGCFWGPVDEACAAVRAKYGEGSGYEAMLRAAAQILADGIKPIPQEASNADPKALEVK